MNRSNALKTKINTKTNEIRLPNPARTIINA